MDTHNGHKERKLKKSASQESERETEEVYQFYRT